MNNVEDEESKINRSHRSTVRKPPQFKQLLNSASKSSRINHRMSIDDEQFNKIDLSNSIQEMSQENENDQIESQRTKSKDLEIVRSKSSLKSKNSEKEEKLNTGFNHPEGSKSM